MSDKSLYSVTIEAHVYVWAEDAGDAEREAVGWECVQESIMHNTDAAFAVQVTKRSDIDADWEDSRPWGEGHNDKTCSELLDDPDDDESDEPPPDHPGQIYIFTKREEER